MQQYLEIKGDHEDALLFFRMGDFYEMFFEDAERAASILDITLTSRNRNDPEPIPMCGFPYHSVKPYVARLLEAGVKVAICEQIELPTKGLARREVTRIVTPGTSLDEETLAPESANYLAAVVGHGEDWGLAWAEFSTGEVRVTALASAAAIEDELSSVAPSEIIAAVDIADTLRARIAEVLPGCMITPEGAKLGSAGGGDVLDSPALADAPAQAAAALELLHGYLKRTQGGRTEHLRPAEYYETGAFVQLDGSTIRNLEVVESTEGKRAGSLLAAVDRSATAMGKRLLRNWLLRPLADAQAIGARLDAVECLYDDFTLREELRQLLREVGDLERLGGRLGSRIAGPRELVRLADVLDRTEEVGRRMAEAQLPEFLDSVAGALEALPELRVRLRRAIVDEPPIAIGKGAVIREGFHEEVDRLRGVAKDGKGWMAAFAEQERLRTGIGKLKIGYNKVFGYYIEVSRAAQENVPESYERKQTLANAERYITEDLKIREAEVLGAEERLLSLESHLHGELLSEVVEHLPDIAATASALARLDVVVGLAETAHTAGHVRPQLADDGRLEILEGRHPVVEAALGSGFIPNDTVLGPDGTRVMVITGPNMAGKSTYLRQTALICLLAHCGAFVPAAEAAVPLLDRIFTRIGASDNLARGQSTFMVEMTETANILANMTENSLVVLDEIGRGTSTFDGISIAWAVAEAMVAGGVKTLFATHYHELAGLAAEHDAVANHSVAVRRYKGDIVFLYRVVEGATSGSYGIEVAKLAGLPAGVIEIARAMLARFETGGSAAAHGAAADTAQQGLFDPRAEAWQAELARCVAEVNVEVLTPVDALTLLDRLVREARKGQ
jgi:DNA mismatch repair protein MutS